jgi:hypothetical protein
MKHISYDDGSVKAEIDIRAASTRDGIQREYLMYNDLPKDPVLVRAQQLFGTLTAAADVKLLERDGQPVKLTVESLLELPGALTTRWSLDVFEVNPHWQFGISSAELEELQKKALKPSSGLEASTEQPTKAKPKT